MFRHTLLLALAASMMLSLCLQSPSPAAAGLVDNQRYADYILDFNPCTGQYIGLDVESHFLVRQTPDGCQEYQLMRHGTGTDIATDSTTGGPLIDPQTGKGIPSPGGQSYVVNQTWSYSYCGSGCPNEFTRTVYDRVISPGPASNLYIRTDIHFAMDADCKVTTNLFNSRLECRG
jgi:hypothetical protein